MDDHGRSPLQGAAAGGGEVVVGVLASPGAAAELAAGLLPQLNDRIAAHLPNVRWVFRLVTERLVQRPAELNDLVAAARRRMLGDSWHLAVCVTDLPLRTARRPVVAHASATHSVAVLSLPALGPVAVGRRATEAIVRLLGALVGDKGDGDTTGRDGRRRLRPAVSRRLSELGARSERDERGLGFVAGVVTGNLQLLLGMLRANRPWRLAARLSRLLVAAFGTAVVALVTSDIWRLADGLGSLRLCLLTAGSVLGTTLTLVLGAGLWERSPWPAAREQVVLFNVVTVATVTIGVLALYLALLGLALLGALLMVPNGLLASQLQHAVGMPDQVDLAWLVTSLATVGGALGAGLETDEAVREAAYAYQPDEELTAAG